MSDVSIRRFEPGDGERVRELNERALRSTGDFVEGVPDPDLDSVPEHYLDGDGEFLVGRVDGELVATAAYHSVEEWALSGEFDFVRPTAELTRMRVDPAHHRRGYGSSLYHELEYRARADGYHQIVLDTGVDNGPARRFYDSLGFGFVSTTSIEGFGETFDLAVYRKSLVG